MPLVKISTTKGHRLTQKGYSHSPSKEVVYRTGAKHRRNGANVVNGEDETCGLAGFASIDY
jgi:hypothetical protein